MPQPAIRIALPKGRLATDVLALCADAGMPFTFASDRDYRPQCKDPRIIAKCVKPRAIPQLIALAQFDLGITGFDVVREAGYDDVVPIHDLGCNAVEIVVGIPRQQPDLLAHPPPRPLRIATEYSNLASAWAFARGFAHIIIPTYGATEAYAPEDADIIVDCVETGHTMEANGLIVVDRLGTSSTCLITHTSALADPARRARFDAISGAFERVLGARYPGGTGAVVICTDGERFLLQRKDRLHPNPKCWDRLSYFGGSLEDGETPEAAIRRELAEEIVSRDAVAAITDALQYWRVFTLEAPEESGRYRCHAFIARVSPDRFSSIIAAVAKDGVTEGVPTVLERSALDAVVVQPAAFVYQLEEIVRAFCADVLRTQTLSA